MSQHGCPERLSDRSKGFQEDGPSQPTMEVLVETLTGTAFEMTVSPSDTIFAIKSKISRVEGIPVSQQHLVYKLRELEDARSLRSLGIGEGARLRLVLGMRGGPISTRRLPPAPAGLAEPWRDIERLLENNREEEWGGGAGSSGGGGGGAGGGCKVTVLVYRDGERVNMLRVRENRDGTYSPIDHSKYSSSLTHLSEAEGEEAPGSLQQNAVTMGKMTELRRRMESLSVRRRVPRARNHHAHATEKAEMQKTRSEETLSVPSLLDDPFARAYAPYSEAEDTFAPLYDGRYTRYEYDCSFADRYTLLPPIGMRTDSEQSMQDAVAESERLQLSELAGSILVAGGRREEGALLEERLDAPVEECRAPHLAAKALAPIPTAEYGPLVGGDSMGWRVVGFGSSSQLSPPAALSPPAGAAGAGGGARPAHAHSASSLHVQPAHAAAPPPPKHHPPLSDALFSSSTSDLEKLKRNRILPALSRHRNREHLHLSDEGLDLSARPRPGPREGPRPRNLEVGSERRQRRIEKIAQLETSSRIYRFGDFEEVQKVEPDPQSPEKEEKEIKVKKLRIRCGFCKKKLSIATVHTCRCGAEFCAPHRYAEVHGCAYDYKANAHQYLQRANPLVSAPKLPKI